MYVGSVTWIDFSVVKKTFDFPQHKVIMYIRQIRRNRPCYTRQAY